MTALPLSKSCAANRTLCETPVGEVREWVCAGHDSGDAEEINAGWSVVVTRRGSFARRTGSDTHLLSPGAASFWNSGESSAMTHPVAGGDQCTVFRVNEETVRGMRAETADAEAEIPLFAIRARRLDGPTYMLHRRALDAARTEVPDKLCVEEAMTEFLGAAHVNTNSRGSRRTPESSRRLAYAAQSIVASRFREPLTLADVARTVGCSPFHLTRLMRSFLGESLHQHVIRLRLREALEQLLDAPHDITRIALETGFASHSHMTTAFRREYGMTPQAARQRASKLSRAK